MGFQNAKIAIYPNSANDIVNLENVSGQLFHFTLFSITGIQYPIQNISYSINQTNIVISNLQSGMYILYMQDEFGAVNAKPFVKL